MRPLFTASAGERASECPPSCALTATASTGEAAARGVSIHAYIRRVLAGASRSDALKLVDPQWRATCEGIDFRQVCADLSGIGTENAYAWNVRTRKARFIGSNLDRNYGPLDPWEIPGTLDIEGIDFRGRAVVWDTKTGQSVGEIKASWQMRFFGIVLRDLRDSDHVEGRLGYVREDGYIRPEIHTFDPFQLDAFEDELQDAAERVAGARATLVQGKHLRVNQGSWCRYCEAFASCPANVSLARSMLPELAEIEGRLAEMSPLELGAVYMKLQSVKRIAGSVEEGLKACAEVQPLELEDGRRVEMTTQDREYFQTSAAIEMLRAKGATEAEISALYQQKTVSGGLRIKGRKLLKGRAA